MGIIKPYFVSEYLLSSQPDWRFREFRKILDRRNRDLSRCKEEEEEEEELEEDEEKSETFIIDNLEDVRELVVVSVFLVNTFSSPLTLLNSSSLR